MSEEQEKKTESSDPTSVRESPGALARASVSLVHDLRGPLVTIDGFGSEIRHTLDELETLLARNPPDADVVATVRDMLTEDLLPCLEFVRESAQVLHARIDALALPIDEPNEASTTRPRTLVKLVDDPDETSEQ